MKILYITDFEEIAKQNGGYISDYLSDLTFHGLKELYGDDVTAFVPPLHLYKGNRDGVCDYLFKNGNMEEHFWGGFTSFYLLDKDYDERVFGSKKEVKEYFNEMEINIKYQKYDLIIYGSFRRCTHLFTLVKENYPQEKIVLLDGEDDDQLSEVVNEGFLYFKRELPDFHNLPSNIKPITFGYPEVHLSKINKSKTQQLGTVVPGDKSTYIFKNSEYSSTTEKEYYDDYNKSYFGLTEKKAGWDCMRHYEIMGNYCLPYFPDINFCPKNTLWNFPKELIIEGNQLKDNFDEQEYFRILDEMFKYFKENLTTKAVAQDLINRINE